MPTITAPARVAAVKMAVEDFNPAAHDMKVEIVSADHQNKPDIGSNIARQWFDVDHVDVIIDVPNSGVALAVSEVAREKNKVLLVSGAAISDLTGPKCSPNTVHWTYDTWMLAHGTGRRAGRRPAAIPGFSSPRIMPSVTRSSATPPRSSRPTAARCWAA